MKRFAFACVLLAAGAVGFLPGCNRSSKTQVGFVSNNAEDFWSIAQAGADKAAAEFNVDVDFKKPSSGTAAEQKEVIDSMLARGVKAVSISVNDPKNQADFLNTVADNVPLIAVDNDAPTTRRRCYIGTDNYAAGRTVGELVKKAMPDGGTVAIFVGQIAPDNAQARWHGVLDGLAGRKDASGKEFGKYTIHGDGADNQPFLDNVDLKKAKDNADDVLTQLSGKDPSRICLVGLWAYNPPALYAAVKHKELQGKVKIVAFDEYKDTLDGVEKGHIFATVVQDPYNFGYKSVQVMAALAKGDSSAVPKDGKIFLPYRVISPERIEGVSGTWVSLKDFRKDLNQKLGSK
jgi:ribose transport system substrate-binding protein